MEISRISRNISQRCSIATIISFGLFLVLTVTIIHQDSRIRKMERKPESNHVITKRSLDDSSADQKKDYKEVVTSYRAVGSLYTRWGRTDCTPYSSLVYDGVAAGEYFDHTGGGSNLLCLPNDPIWANATKQHEVAATIYGTEYQISEYHNKMFVHNNPETLHDHNVPCAVCMTRQPAVIMMLPARTYCYAGWSVEYSGYLMTAHNGHKGRQDYVCVDREPEADPAGYRDENGALLYFVQAVCGSLPCPPYVAGKELTCVVCRKY
ncbi:short-chain collagen C4-like [Argonauta hians]